MVGRMDTALAWCGVQWVAICRERLLEGRAVDRRQGFFMLLESLKASREARSADMVRFHSAAAAAERYLDFYMK